LGLEEQEEMGGTQVQVVEVEDKDTLLKELEEMELTVKLLLCTIQQHFLGTQLQVEQ
jgi:hypothetical protein